ncbi:mannose-1-phosphate guanylyltransferase/mannose-6-phosphate isomerase [Pandoraea apista]|uniref:mannose-1-phosphate guanylyltransferase n=1 Tax=Pandoraea apista TaxID=93218 RepID=A0A5E5P7Q9_9BURK|nr:mannose-1-phosphate guanylyltransferase/mannose-6-phosphate isomerase [Pandoraea apista]AJE98060.1 mannose-1-phosphate guanylyltransferase [Pandoraea apista]AKH72063.1 mannose-1-phosphate guanylyltransferase [Pandoraea apista]AKI64337.1 mannose-1-phosphate guanylyltransferase [Pandoraea apista]AVF38631.1 mannose-1-phosphate guanylyltransferase/mannose-6-phosphate isomerase [Pandoraea apista]OXS94726.1 mannose-1-phosphate guanylyltransferase/mannose-6-phosphate isomerase [Pandoraea apista]
MSITPVILCGGSGTRLWPLSRASYPKQYLSLAGSDTLLQQTVKRIGTLEGATAPLIISNNEQRFLVAEQLRAIDTKPSAIVLEPVARNTAPAVAAAALIALRQDANAMLLVLPSDHVIANEAKFLEAVRAGRTLANDDFLVTFGIPPASPHTGYGYIRRGKATEVCASGFHVDQYVEKPDAKTAESLIAAGHCYWNSGMFLFKAKTYLDELERLAPEMFRQVNAAVEHGAVDIDFFRLDQASLEACPSDSIDYAVMEKAHRAAVVDADGLGWNDIGSWSAVAEIAERDGDGNSLLGDVVARGVKNSYVRSESRMVAAIGVDDLVIVETPDVVLVASKDRVQEVKSVVEKLIAEGRPESVFHQRVFRPWGSYEGICVGERFQVKKIVVKPGASLSLQMHFHRSEHWVVVRGTARVTNGENTILLTENQSTYIPVGTTHRLENPGKVPLELIEVQSGAYLGEDDIVRFEDNYGRSK